MAKDQQWVQIIRGVMHLLLSLVTVDLLITSITPIMELWNEQWKGLLPGEVNVNWYVPVDNDPESKPRLPPTLVTVCAWLFSHDHTTVSPTWIVNVPRSPELKPQPRVKVCTLDAAVVSAAVGVVLGTVLGIAVSAVLGFRVGTTVGSSVGKGFT